MIDILTDGLEQARIGAKLDASRRRADRVALTFINSDHPETQQDEAGMQHSLATFCRAQNCDAATQGELVSLGEIARWSSGRTMTRKPQVQVAGAKCRALMWPAAAKSA
jgi:hypothetical protein